MKRIQGLSEVTGMKKLLQSGKVGLFLWMLSAVFIILGIYRGEAATVFQKATAICLECIGIG